MDVFTGGLIGAVVALLVLVLALANVLLRREKPKTERRATQVRRHETETDDYGRSMYAITVAEETLLPTGRGTYKESSRVREFYGTTNRDFWREMPSGGGVSDYHYRGWLSDQVRGFEERERAAEAAEHWDEMQ